MINSKTVIAIIKGYDAFCTYMRNVSCDGVYTMQDSNAKQV